MKSHNNILLSICFLLLIINPNIQSVSGDKAIDFRNITCDNYGIDISYKIAEGTRINNLFENMGFSLQGSLGGSTFHVMIKNHKKAIQDIYNIESDSYILENVSIYSLEHYLITDSPLKVYYNLSSPYLSQLMDYELNIRKSKIIESDIPSNSTLIFPQLFTSLSRPNLGSLLNNLDVFDFLPFILGTDYARYEAEFTLLALNENISVNIFNQGYDEFTLALKTASEPEIGLKASWEKNTGLLTELSLKFTQNSRSNIFSIRFEGYNIIPNSLDSKEVNFFVSNSKSSYEFYNGKEYIRDTLEETTEFINQINNSEAIKFVFDQNSGLVYDWNIYFKDPDTGNYESDTLLHTTFLNYLQPIVIPIWERYEGLIDLAKELWKNIAKELIGLEIYLSNTTSYLINDIELKLQRQKSQQLNHLLVDLNIEFQRININLLANREEIQTWKMDTFMWLAYSDVGLLNAFSIEFEQNYSFVFDPPSTDPSRETRYFQAYQIESKPTSISKPEFTIEPKKTCYKYSFTWITITICFTYVLIKKKRLGAKKI